MNIRENRCFCVLILFTNNRCHILMLSSKRHTGFCGPLYIDILHVPRYT